jgi:uroporphyrinogen decarboxylase
VEITPEVFLELPLKSPDNTEDYQGIIAALKHYRHDRGRFCYMQSNGIFECLNGPFGIENHLLYLALYPEVLKEVYKRQAEWNVKFAEHIIELGMDMIHVSDDWGSQNSLMFSKDMLHEMIVPYHKMVSDCVKKAGKFLSLHSDGNINQALDAILEIGYDAVHPWQETAGMSYDTYVNGYSNKFAILGGVCIQSVLGFGDYERLEAEIKRVFRILKNKRWMCCTTHFVQEHCGFEELEFAYDLIYKLANA